MAKRDAPALSATVDGRLLVLDFSNGQSIRANADDLTAELRERAMMHGLEQKLRDAAAIPAREGVYPTVAEKYEAVREVYERLFMDGEWNKAREGAPTGGILLLALMRHTGKSPDVLRPWLSAKSREEKEALRLNPEIKRHVDAIEAERAAERTKGLDSNAMLGELGNL